MAKFDESEGEVLSRDEMKTTKGGAGAAAAASQAGVSASQLKSVEASALDATLQQEAQSASISAKRVEVGVNVPPSAPVKK
jgi:hypothetical protein